MQNKLAVFNRLNTIAALKGTAEGVATGVAHRLGNFGDAQIAGEELAGFFKPYLFEIGAEALPGVSGEYFIDITAGIVKYGPQGIHAQGMI